MRFDPEIIEIPEIELTGRHMRIDPPEEEEEVLDEQIAEIIEDDEPAAPPPQRPKPDPEPVAQEVGDSESTGEVTGEVEEVAFDEVEILDPTPPFDSGESTNRTSTYHPPPPPAPSAEPSAQMGPEDDGLTNPWGSDRRPPPPPQGPPAGPRFVDRDPDHGQGRRSNAPQGEPERQAGEPDPLDATPKAGEHEGAPHRDPIFGNPGPQREASQPPPRTGQPGQPGQQQGAPGRPPRQGPQPGARQGPPPGQQRRPGGSQQRNAASRQGQAQGQQPRGQSQGQRQGRPGGGPGGPGGARRRASNAARSSANALIKAPVIGRRRRDPAAYEAPKENVALDTARGAGEWLSIILVAVAAAMIVKMFVVQAFFIPSGSMEETLQVDDRVLVSKLSYKVGDIHRGDIVVFKSPPNEPDKSIKDLIKRVIALPGDTVESRQGVLYLNGAPLSEPYLEPGTTTDGVKLQTIPTGMLWVMGDNRGDSADSRVIGPIDENLVVGKTVFRVWPLGSFGLVH